MLSDWRLSIDRDEWKSSVRTGPNGPHGPFNQSINQSLVLKKKKFAMQSVKNFIAAVSCIRQVAPYSLIVVYRVSLNREQQDIRLLMFFTARCYA